MTFAELLVFQARTWLFIYKLRDSLHSEGLERTELRLLQRQLLESINGIERLANLTFGVRALDHEPGGLTDG